MKTVAIIGGGIAGLSAGEAIRALVPDARVRILEAAPQPGGKITTRKVDGFVIETGPHGFLDKEPKAMALVDRLGLTPRLLKANEASAARFIVRGGRLRQAPSSPPAFLTSDLLPFGARMRVLLEPFQKQRRSTEDETVWDFAARRLGPVAADVLIDAFVTGIYGGDPHALSLPSAFPRLAELEGQYGSLIKAQLAIARKRRKDGGPTGQAGGPAGTLNSFGAGLGVWIDALVERAEVTCDFRAEAVKREGAGFRVEGGPEPIDADAVVVTAPAFEAARLLRPFAEAEAAELDAIPYAPVAVVVHGYRAEDLGHDLAGFGFLVPDQERRSILGSIWASTVFAGHAPDGTVMLRTLLGGSRRPEHAEGDDATLLARARAELVALMGIRSDTQPVLEHVVRWPRGIPQYTIGHSGRAAAADALEARVPGVFVGGNALRGVAMIQCVVDADRIAERVAGYLAKSA